MFNWLNTMLSFGVVIEIGFIIWVLKTKRF